MSSLINVDTDEVVATAGENRVTRPNGDNGGSIASGHPFWFSRNYFTVIDRANREISVYRVDRHRVNTRNYNG